MPHFILDCSENILNKYKKGVTEALSTIANSDASITNNDTYQNLLSSVKKSLSSMDQVTVSNSTSSESTFNLLNGLVNDANALLKATLELSELSLDSNANTKSMIDFATRDLKSYSNTVGLLRATGAYSLTQAYLSSTNADALDAISGKLYEIQPQLERTITLMVPEGQPKIKEHAMSLVKEINRLLEVVDIQIMTATELNTPWEDFFNDISGFTDLQYSLSSQVFAEVDKHFATRLDEQSGKLTLISVAIGVVM